MGKLQQDIDAEIRQTPLIERLKQARKTICTMCGELRPPRMSIPPRAVDEDEFICLTLDDAHDSIFALEVTERRAFEAAFHLGRRSAESENYPGWEATYAEYVRQGRGKGEEN